MLNEASCHYCIHTTDLRRIIVVSRELKVLWSDSASRLSLVRRNPNRVTTRPR